MVLLPAALWAQLAPASGSPSVSADYSRLYCSGFITRDSISRANFVLGSTESPHEDRFAQRMTLFLRGPELVANTRYSVVRQVMDPNHVDSSPEQRKRLAGLGSRYDDIGWVTVHSVENGTAIATFDFACEATLPGDILVPFHERPQAAVRNPAPPLESFRAGSAALTGQILGARDNASVYGNGMVVYTDFCSNKGVKTGDFLVISRGYAPQDLNRVDRASDHLPRGLEMSAVDPAVIPPDSDSLMPNRILGELVVLSTSPEASVAMITRNSAEVEIGDKVQLEGAPVGQAASVPVPSGDSDSRLHRAIDVLKDTAQKVK